MRGAGARGAHFPSRNAPELRCSSYETPLAERHFVKNEKSVFFRLTRVGRFDTLLTRCAANGGAHPISPPPRAASGAQAPLFENGTAFSGFALGRAATLGGAREAGPDSKVSLC